MNNKLKFRVWNKEEKRFINFVDVKKQEIEFNFDTKDNYFLIECDPGKYKILQCTGLRDKNGKLVYEKDILLSPDYDEPYMVIVEWGNEKGYIVKAWNGKEFEYALSDDTLESLKYFEIIGNEFENPELLEESHE